MITKQEYLQALKIINDYQYQFVEMNMSDKLFVGLNFITNVNGNKTDCIITDISYKKYSCFGDESDEVEVELVTFDGTYESMSPATNSMKEYKTTWSLSKGQIINMGTKWAKDLEISKRRDRILTEIV